MGFRPGALAVIACANGFTWFHYRTADPPAAVAEAGYFDRSRILAAGDRVTVSLVRDEGAPGLLELYVADTAGGRTRVTPIGAWPDDLDGCAPADTTAAAKAPAADSPSVA